jgi:hypothetical protein
VTSDWRIDAAAARRIVVKETWSVPAGPAWRRAVMAAAALVAVAAAALARASWVAASQAQNSW